MEFDDDPIMTDEIGFTLSLDADKEKSIPVLKLLLLEFTGNPNPILRLGNWLFKRTFWVGGICIDIGIKPVFMSLIGKENVFVLMNGFDCKLDCCCIVEVKDENC